MNDAEKNNAVLSETQQRLNLLRDSAGKYSAHESHLKRARALRGSRPGYDKKIWKEMADLGWLGTMLPEKFGGLSLGCSEMAVIAEQLGRSLFPEPVTVAAVLAGGALLYGDNEALKDELLPALAAGDMIPVLASREETHSDNPLAVEARAEDTAAGVKLYGTKRVVVGGVGADGYIVSARGGKGISLYWLPAASIISGLTALDLADGRAVAELKLDGIEVPSRHRVAGPGVAENALTRAYDEALIMTSAELLGVLSRALEITLEYMRTRVQFGKAIGSFQALQFRAVDLYIGQRLCRHTVDEIAASIDAGISAGERGALASRAKARCAEVGLRITKEAIQMHGAMGYSDECDIGMFLMRTVALSAWLGGVDFHRSRFAELSPVAA